MFWILSSFFSFRYLPRFLKSSRSCVVVLPTISLPPSALQWNHKEGNFYLKNIQYNWFFNADNCLEAFLFPFCTSKNLFVSYFLWPVMSVWMYPTNSLWDLILLYYNNFAVNGDWSHSLRIPISRCLSSVVHFNAHVTHPADEHILVARHFPFN